MKSLGEEFKERKNETWYYNRTAFQTVRHTDRYHQQDSEWRDKISTLCNIEGTE